MKRRILISVAITLLGACAGWIYWRYVGCSSGSCAITSSPLNSSLYGALMGWLLGDLVQPKRAKNAPSPPEPIS